MDYITQMFKKHQKILTENYTPVSLIQFYDFVKETKVESVLENSEFVFSEPTKGVENLMNIIKENTIYAPELRNQYTKLMNFRNKAINGHYENNDHIQAVTEAINEIYDLIVVRESTEFLRNDTIRQINDDIKKIDAVMESKEIILEGTMDMCPTVAYPENSEEEAHRLYKKRLELQFSSKFVETFMDDTEDEIEMESFTQLMKIANTYEAITEGKINKVMKKAAVKGDTVSRKMANGARKSRDEANRVKNIAKKIPGHFEALVNNTINKVKSMDIEERRKRIVEGGFRFKILKLIRNSILFGTAWAVAPALAGIGLIAGVALDRKIDDKVRQKFIRELEQELQIVNEKIEDARGDQNKQKKYQLMRIKNKLEHDIERVTYRLDKVVVNKRGVHI